MSAFREKIIQKYRHVANLPDVLFAFTFPLRHKAIQKLGLMPGSHILDIGCSSGANFRFLEQAVGKSGQITGVDLSPDMVRQARLRIEKNGWQNIRVIEQAAEETYLSEPVDGVLLFAMHDVLTSPLALDRALACLKPGGKVAAAGPMLAAKLPGKMLNPMIRNVFRRFAVSNQDMDCPWRLLAERVKLEVEILGPGIMYLVWGTI